MAVGVGSLMGQKQRLGETIKEPNVAIVLSYVTLAQRVRGHV